MILIVGLGNPGRKFQKSRHNLGFMVIEGFRIKNDFKEFKFSRKSNSLISGGFINNQRIILARPQTFMNNSGQSVKLLLKKLNNSAMTELMSLPNRLFVIHDDIDLPLGKIKIVKNRGAGGHKGVESIIKELKTKNFIRFRIGIQPKIGKPKNVEKYVLQKFSKTEEKVIRVAIKKTCLAIGTTLKKGLEKTMAQYN